MAAVVNRAAKGASSSSPAATDAALVIGIAASGGAGGAPGDADLRAALLRLEKQSGGCSGLPAETRVQIIGAVVPLLGAAGDDLTADTLLPVVGTLSRASIVYGEGVQLVSALQTAVTIKQLVGMLEHEDARVVIAVSKLLGQMSSTGSDNDVDAVLASLRAHGIVDAVLRACLLHTTTAQAGHCLCDLLYNAICNEPDAIAAVLANRPFTDHVTTALLSTDHCMWFEDHMPGPMLLALLVARGENGAARALVERNDHMLIRSLNNCITCDDRGEGTIVEWVMAAGAILRRGVDGGAEANSEEGEEDEEGEDMAPTVSIYAGVFEECGAKATLGEYEGGRHLLGIYFSGA
jgi:hypothetical protein